MNTRNQCRKSSDATVTAAVKHFVNDKRSVNARQDGEELVTESIEVGEMGQYLEAQGLEDTVIEIDGIGCGSEVVEEISPLFGVQACQGNRHENTVQGKEKVRQRGCTCV